MLHSRWRYKLLVWTFVLPCHGIWNFHASDATRQYRVVESLEQLGAEITGRFPIWGYLQHSLGLSLTYINIFKVSFLLGQAVLSPLISFACLFVCLGISVSVFSLKGSQEWHKIPKYYYNKFNQTKHIHTLGWYWSIKQPNEAFSVWTTGFWLTPNGWTSGHNQAKYLHAQENGQLPLDS